MTGVIHNPHAPLVPAAVVLVNLLTDVQPYLTALLTALTIGWYLYLYYREWNQRKK